MAPLGPSDLVRINPRALLTELGDGTGVVLDLDTKFYFNLNRTGVAVWKTLAAHSAGASALALADTLVGTFDVERDAALADVLALLQAMADEGLVTVAARERP